MITPRRAERGGGERVDSRESEARRRGAHPLEVATSRLTGSLPAARRSRLLACLTIAAGCARRPPALREAPSVVEAQVGALDAGPLRVRLVATATSSPLGSLRGGSHGRIQVAAPAVHWRVEVGAEGELSGARGSLGVFYRCAFETRTLLQADLRAALGQLRVLSAAAADGRAVVAVTASRWRLPCAPPDGRYRAVYRVGGSALTSPRAVRADSPADALTLVPDARAWLREALGPAPSPFDAEPVPPPLIPGEPRRAPLPAGIGHGIAALQLAVHESVVLDEAMAYTLRGTSMGMHPRTDQRLLERLGRNDPPTLRAVVLRVMVPSSKAPADRGPPAWGQQVGEALPDPAGARAQDLDRQRAVASLAWRLPRAHDLGAERAAARVEALRAATSLGDAVLVQRAAVAILGGSAADATRVADLGPLLDEHPDAKWAAARAVSGRCEADVVAAAFAGLRSVPHPSRVACACVLARCATDEQVRAAVERAAPRGNLDDRVLPMRPAWCRAPDAAAPGR